MKNKNGEFTDKVGSFQNVISELDYKVSLLSKQVESIQQVQPGAPPSGNQGDTNGGYGFNKYENENQIKFLKDLISEER